MTTVLRIRSRLLPVLLAWMFTITAGYAQPGEEAEAPFGGAVIEMQNGRALGGKPSRVRAGNMQVAPGQPGAVPPSATPDGQPASPGQPAVPPGSATPDAGAAPLADVKRTSEPPEPPNPEELKAKPNNDGLVQFQFRNQPWPEVVRWLAAVSELSLDWQELPGDYINLATQRPFTLEEASDMINRALLARGFTLLKHEGVLLVAKVESLNPALVPRVRAEELANLPPHSYVRTSFPLTWLIADEIHEEFASMISKNGKLTPLGSTNRLEGMDAASNLRDIYEILEMEQSAKALENLAREFILEHARASSIKVQLEEFLGINRPGGGGGGGGGGSRDAMQQQMQMQMQQQMQQMQQQMQQAQQQAGGAKPTRRRTPQEVFLVANDRSNSLIVHASPDKMAIIASFISRVDVPNENAADFQRMNTRMKVFRLASLSPLELVNSLNSMDVLEPTTRLQVDATNNAIIAYASIADQYLIQSVVERLDGSERTFEVIQLRRLEAEAVAGSIKFLMGADEEDTSNNRRNNFSYYDYYGGYGGGSSNKQQKSDKMRVGANVQDNQVLLWANPMEMEEVQKLLVKLGEVPPAGGRRNTTRVIDASRQPETFEYLQRLKEQWERVSPNPLDIPDASQFAPPKEEIPVKPATPDTSKPEAEKPAAGNPPAPNKAAPIANGKITFANPPAATQPISNSADTLNSQRLVSSPFVQTFQQPAAAPKDEKAPLGNTPLTADDGEADSASETNTTALDEQPLTTSGNSPSQDEQLSAPPVQISIDSDGNLIIQSNDMDALDRLEEVMLANRPPQKPYDIFKVKYARASWVSLNLEEYFEKKDEESNRFFSFFFDGRPPKDKEESQLGKKPPLRFIYDNDTKSIVVQGASNDDRKTIKELIELWDVPEPDDEEDKNRYTKLLRIKHSRADAIVNTIKEAYRDLLSATDKSVQPQQGGNEEEKRSGDSGGIVQSGGGLNYAFKGKLSLGADTITNSILISAEGQALMDIISDMIEQLDKAARPEGNVEVYQLSAGVNGKSLERALRAILQSPSQQSPGAQQGQNAQPTPEANEAQAPPSNRGGQGRRDGRGGNRRNPSQIEAVFGGE